MSGADACVVVGVIVESLGEGVWRVELPNGHRLVARLLRRDRAAAGRYGVGSQVTLAVSPADPTLGIVRVNAGA